MIEDCTADAVGELKNDRPVAKIDRPSDIVSTAHRYNKSGTAGHEDASVGKHVFEIPLINHVQ